MTRRHTGPTAETRDLVFERARACCEVCGDADGPFQIHHRRPRGMGGTRRIDTNSPANLLNVDERCHARIESQRDAARRGGLLVSQRDNPAEVPAFLICGWTYLTVDGRYAACPSGDSCSDQTPCGSCPRKEAS